MQLPTITTFPDCPYPAIEVLGFIPQMLDINDPRPVREQLHTGYAHGGGWRPFGKDKFTMTADHILNYPDDPPMDPWILIDFRDEKVIVYAHSFVAIVQPDGNFEVARMD